VRFFATRKIIDAIDYLKSIAPTIVKYTCWKFDSSALRVLWKISW
jgi:hypothetical protein